jgi:DNA-directed RNA polymerase specialized sigma24 family protein
VALSAFDSFCRGAARGHFPRLSDRDDLWRLLVVITARKASHLIRDENRQKRGGGAPAGPPARPGLFWVDQELAGLVDSEPTPEFAAQVAEECRRLLKALGDAELESVALWKMEGYTNEEIAGRLGCVARSVERKLRLIRKIWSKEMTP